MAMKKTDPKKTSTPEASAPDASVVDPIVGPIVERGLVIGLNAVIVSMVNQSPCVLIVPETSIDKEYDPLMPVGSLPFGPFDPVQDRTMEIGLRSWVKAQADINIGYVEQLYTFGDRGRHPHEEEDGPRMISVGYLGLTHAGDQSNSGPASWLDWYACFPWEDWRLGEPAILGDKLFSGLDRWCSDGSSKDEASVRRDRVRLCFGLEGVAWDDEKVLERYELLYEAELVAEAIRDRFREAKDGEDFQVIKTEVATKFSSKLLNFDHRRILATAITRLRAKIKYRPVIFELMPATFTLLQLQKCAEALSGITLHKQNFRRLVEQGGLVERTGQMEASGRGRPAEQFRFRHEVVNERSVAGVRSPTSRRR
jgi:hypothetical protein